MWHVRAYMVLVRKREGKPPPDQVVDGRIILRSVLDRSGGAELDGTGSESGQPASSSLAEKLSASQGLCSMQLVS
jgi:hypothetical protein